MKMYALKTYTYLWKT